MSRVGRRSKFVCEAVPVIQHPLASSTTTIREPSPGTDGLPSTCKGDDKSVIVKNGSNNADEAEFFDPLGALNGATVVESVKVELLTRKKSSEPERIQLFNDGPLSNTLEEEERDVVPNLDPKLIGFRPWAELKEEIYNYFHSDSRLHFESSFLKTTESVKTKNKLTVGEKSASRPLKINDLSEQEFTRKLTNLRKVFLKLWEDEERISCIALIKEVTSTLTQTTVGQFYPKLFVMVTDFLDIFGKLVYDRLLHKAKTERAELGLSPLPTHFQTIDVLEKTRLVARNWFGKLCEIKEVVPRICMDSALMPCMVFVDDMSVLDNLMRLSQLVCAVKHPLSASYLRAYICRCAMRCEPSERGPHWKCLNDWMQSFHQQPTQLLWPALEYVVQCVAYNAVTYNDVLPLWEYCKLGEKRPFVLKAVLKSLPPHYLAEHALDACKLLVAGGETAKAEELVAFGRTLLKDNVAEAARRPLLKHVWREVGQQAQLNDFVACVEVWVEFVARYFTVKELQFVLDDLVRRLQPDRKFEQHQTHLLDILGKTLKQARDVAQVLGMPVVPHYLALFTDKDTTKDMAVLVLETFVEKHAPGQFQDLSLAYQVNDICKLLHNTVTVFSSPEEVAEVVDLICAALTRFDLKHNPMDALSFYVAVRASLLNIDRCQAFVVHLILELALFVVRSARFSSTRAQFVKACISSAYITIPSVAQLQLKLELIVAAAQVALAGLAFLQVDHLVQLFMKEARRGPPLGQTPALARVSAQFLAFFSGVPAFEDNSYLDLVEGWVDLVEKVEPSPSGNAEILLNTLKFLYALKRPADPARPGRSEWMVDKSARFTDRIDRLLERAFARIAAETASESEKKPLLSIQFLEVLALFVGKVDDLVMTEAWKAAQTRGRGQKP